MLLKFISAAYYTRWTNTPMVGTGTTVRMMNISGQRVAQPLCRLPAGIAKLISRRRTQCPKNGVCGVAPPGSSGDFPTPSGMVYGPIGAFLAEFFPSRIRYTSVSVPYHIGNGWGGGGLVPFIHHGDVPGDR
jgi:hypothetical protein